VDLYLQIDAALLGEIVRRINLLTAGSWGAEDDGEGSLTPSPSPIGEGSSEIALHPFVLANADTNELRDELSVGGIRDVAILGLEGYLTRFSQGFLPELLKVLGHGCK
jgi:hypothetical protein